MKLTAELLSQYDACGKGFDWFKEKYPQGAELIDIMNDSECDMHFLHWGYHYLDISPEEKALYLEKARIKNSSFIYDSEDVSECTALSNCSKMIRSKFCSHSTQVTDSEEVYQSEDITKSSEIFFSERVINSHYISNSTDIKHSSKISNSSLITTSHNILDSLIVTDSAYVWQCRQIRRVAFGAFLNNVTNALCSAGMENCTNIIFNQPVSPTEFAQYYAQFLLLAREMQYPNPLIVCDSNIHLHDSSRCNFQFNYPTLIQNLPSKLLNFIKTLPYYSDELFNQVFFYESK